MLDIDKLASAAAFAALIVAAGAPRAQPTSNSLVPGIAPYAPKAATGPKGPAAAEPAPATAAPDAPTASTEGAAGGYEYTLGAGDKLRVTVYGEPDLTGEFYVAGNGHISFPLIGEIPASGLTLGKVRDEIQTALRDGYIKDPRVSAEVLTFRPYYIFGEIGKPGEYPYSDGITIMNAIATAGGFTYRANSKYVLLKHSSENNERKVRLTDVLKLSPGDSVRIMQRYF